MLLTSLISPWKYRLDIRCCSLPRTSTYNPTFQLSRPSNALASLSESVIGSLLATISRYCIPVRDKELFPGYESIISFSNFFFQHLCVYIQRNRRHRFDSFKNWSFWQLEGCSNTISLVKYRWDLSFKKIMACVVAADSSQRRLSRDSQITSISAYHSFRFCHEVGLKSELSWWHSCWSSENGPPSNNKTN